MKHRFFPKRALALLIVLPVALSLGGCRRRVLERVGDSDVAGSLQSGAGVSARADVDPALPPETRYEARLDASAPEELSASADGGARATNVKTDGEANNRVTLDEITLDGGETKPSDEGGTVGAIVDQYDKVLSQGLGTLYECQIGSVYLETEADYVTANRHSELHRLILDAGGSNAAEKRGDDKLTVDGAWMLRKNPGLIVKLVGRDVLGPGVSDPSAARAVLEGIMARPGWSGLGAVLGRNVLLLSSALLETETGRFAAKLYISTSLYPTLFEEIDADAVCERIADEAGLYAFRASAQMN